MSTPIQRLDDGGANDGGTSSGPVPQVAPGDLDSVNDTRPPRVISDSPIQERVAGRPSTVIPVMYIAPGPALPASMRIVRPFARRIVDRSNSGALTRTSARPG